MRLVLRIRARFAARTTDPARGARHEVLPIGRGLPNPTDTTSPGWSFSAAAPARVKMTAYADYRIIIPANSH
jgi:hypothetical protein